MRTAESAKGRWFDILRKLGVDESFLSRRQGPCPSCGGKDRFRFDDKFQNGDHYCNQCGPGDGFSLLRKVYNWDFARAAKEIDKIIGECTMTEAAPAIDPLKRLRGISSKLVPVLEKSPTWRYLKSRGIDNAPGIKEHPSLVYYEDGIAVGTYPAMVAKMYDMNGKPASLHITYITHDGLKAKELSPKKLLPPAIPISGGAIRLSLPSEVMGIAEGIETALSCKVLKGIDTWASYSATMLENFMPPPECKHLHIFADNDLNFTGQKAAYTLANRLVTRRDNPLRVEVHLPPQGQDWNDVLRGQNG